MAYPALVLKAGIIFSFKYRVAFTMVHLKKKTVETEAFPFQLFLTRLVLEGLQLKRTQKFYGKICHLTYSFNIKAFAFKIFLTRSLA